MAATSSLSLNILGACPRPKGRRPTRRPPYVQNIETQFSNMGKATFLAHIRSLQLNLRQVLEETKDSKLGTVIGHELYPEFVSISHATYMTSS